jgi:hypothetical protein
MPESDSVNKEAGERSCVIREREASANNSVSKFDKSKIRQRTNGCEGEFNSVLDSSVPFTRFADAHFLE